MQPNQFEPVAGYVDLQVNGYVGTDFNDPASSRDRLKIAALAMRADGVSKALPTVITASINDMCQCISNLQQLIHRDSEVADIFPGLHLEGPFISAEPGYIGAHPPQHARRQDLAILARLLDTGQGLVRLVTLAPEVDPHGLMTQMCCERGICVAAGHTNASLPELDCTLEAGLSLFTHLGNGCPKHMDRHDNIIYRALSRSDRLRYSLIADGFHVPELLFRNLLQWLPLDRIAVVSDAISAAGLGPGTYMLGKREVNIGLDRAAVDASGQHFVGSASTLRDADRWLAESLELSLHSRTQLLQANPLAWLTDDYNGQRT